MYEKTNIPGYMKDKKSGIVINTNNREYEQILELREKRKKELENEHKIEKIEHDIHELKNNLEEIKELLKKALRID